MHTVIPVSWTPYHSVALSLNAQQSHFCPVTSLSSLSWTAAAAAGGVLGSELQDRSTVAANSSLASPDVISMAALGSAPVSAVSDPTAGKPNSNSNVRIDQIYLNIPLNTGLRATAPIPVSVLTPSVDLHPLAISCMLAAALSDGEETFRARLLSGYGLRLDDNISLLQRFNARLTQQLSTHTNVASSSFVVQQHYQHLYRQLSELARVWKWVSRMSQHCSWWRFFLPGYLCSFFVLYTGCCKLSLSTTTAATGVATQTATTVPPSLTNLPRLTHPNVFPGVLLLLDDHFGSMLDVSSSSAANSSRTTSSASARSASPQTGLGAASLAPPNLSSSAAVSTASSPSPSLPSAAGTGSAAHTATAAAAAAAPARKPATAALPPQGQQSAGASSTTSTLSTASSTASARRVLRSIPIQREQLRVRPLQLCGWVDTVPEEDDTTVDDKLAALLTDTTNSNGPERAATLYVIDCLLAMSPSEACFLRSCTCCIDLVLCGISTLAVPFIF